MFLTNSLFSRIDSKLLTKFFQRVCPFRFPFLKCCQWFLILMSTCRKNSTKIVDLQHFKILQWRYYQRRENGQGLFSRDKPDICLSLLQQFPPSCIKHYQKVISLPSAFTLLAESLKFTMVFLVYVVLSLTELFSICSGSIEGRQDG